MNCDFRVFFKKRPVVKIDVSDDAEIICNNPYLIGVAEISVNIELSNLQIGSRTRRHGSIACFVWSKRIIEVSSFDISFQLMIRFAYFGLLSVTYVSYRRNQRASNWLLKGRSPGRLVRSGQQGERKGLPVQKENLV